MKMRLIEVVSLINLTNTFQQQNLPIKTAFKLNKILVSIDSHFTFYRTKISELIEKYGLRDEAGNLLLTEDGAGYQIKPEEQDICNLQIQELSDLEVEVPGDIKFTLDELDGISLNVQDMYLFSRFIEEEEKE